MIWQKLKEEGGRKRKKNLEETKFKNISILKVAFDKDKVKKKIYSSSSINPIKND